MITIFSYEKSIQVAYNYLYIYISQLHQINLECFLVGLEKRRRRKVHRRGGDAWCFVMGPEMALEKKLKGVKWKLEKGGKECVG